MRTEIVLNMLNLEREIDRLGRIMQRLVSTSGFTYDLENTEVREARNKFYATLEKRNEYRDQLRKLIWCEL